jgi:hypothetical protein
MRTSYARSLTYGCHNCDDLNSAVEAVSVSFALNRLCHTAKLFGQQFRNWEKLFGALAMMNKCSEQTTDAVMCWCTLLAPEMNLEKWCDYGWSGRVKCLRHGLTRYPVSRSPAHMQSRIPCMRRYTPKHTRLLHQSTPQPLVQLMLLFVALSTGVVVIPRLLP